MYVLFRVQLHDEHALSACRKLCSPPGVWSILRFNRTKPISCPSPVLTMQSTASTSGVLNDSHISANSVNHGSESGDSHINSPFNLPLSKAPSIERKGLPFLDASYAEHAELLEVMLYGALPQSLLILQNNISHHPSTFERRQLCLETTPRKDSELDISPVRVSHVERVSNRSVRQRAFDKEEEPYRVAEVSLSRWCNRDGMCRVNYARGHSRRRIARR